MRFAQAVEESFRQGATRVILAGIKGDLKRGKFTLKEWPQMLSLLQTAMETGKVKGAKSEVVKWEQIEEQRKDIGHVAEVRKRISIFCDAISCYKNDHFAKTSSGQT